MRVAVEGAGLRLNAGKDEDTGAQAFALPVG